MIGVISLPAGVFQPYSGVKTSILILDKEKSKKSKDIFFINIENDGYSLNSNRNEINKNDLPQAILNIKDNKNINKIESNKILNSDDISFVYSKYIEENINNDLKYNKTKISEIVDIFSGSRQKGGSLKQGIPSIGGGQIGKNGNILNDKMVFISEEHFNSMKKGQLKLGDVLIVKDGATTGKIGFYKGEYSKAAINEHVFALRTKESFNNYFLFYILKNDNFQKKLKPFIQGIIGGINLKFLNIHLPFPPIEVQNEIVEELNGCQKVIDGCRQVIENYKPIIDIDPSWEMVDLNSLCSVITKGSTPTTYGHKFQTSGINFIKVETISQNNEIDINKMSFIDEKCHNDFKRSQLEENDIVISIAGYVGISAKVSKDHLPANTNQALSIIRLNDKKFSDFILNYLQTKTLQISLQNIKVGVAQSNLSLEQIKNIKVPKIDIEIANKISNLLSEQKKVISLNRQLINDMNKKIDLIINNVWSN